MAPSSPPPGMIHEVADATLELHPGAEPPTREYAMEGVCEQDTPPPHLRERLNRSRFSNARRKSSAASSRRNSLSSSVHSHASSIAHRRALAGTCQSNHVAQYLRRSSFFESRRARLADNAAHHEEVRQRAAALKAAPRASVSASEERALAARLAKAKHLAKVAAACAEEVARAKRVAEEVKERKLADGARVRLEMEERHAEAEKRRAEYQRNLQARRSRRADSAGRKLAVLEEVADLDEEAAEGGRTGALARTSTRPAIDCDEASRRIQTAWRLYRRAAIVRRFGQLRLREQTAEVSFEQFTALIAEASTIAATTAMLTLLGLQHANDDNATLNTRTFLSSFMILGKPTAVLNNHSGAQEQDLISKASDLLTQFESIQQRLASWNNYSANPTRLEALSQTYSAYTSAFAAWRLQDSSVLIEGMVASFVELDAIWQTVKDDTRGEVAGDYREGIRDNQVMLLARIRRLAGPERADVMIKRAIRESRRRRPRRRPAAEVRPRGVEVVQADAAPPSEAAIEPVVLPETLAAPRAEGVTSLFTPLPSNRVLTHELAIDKDYRLEDSSATAKLKTHVYRSLCESMRRGFEQGDGAAWTISAAENVREKLLRMMKPGTSMHTVISEATDLDLIRRQSEQGVFSYDGFFNLMANTLPKLCAPFRDEEVHKLGMELQESNDELGVMTEKLFKLLRMVDLLSLDYTNFMIMSAAPTLVREAAAYEQRTFAADLESGSTTLDKTRRWWQASRAQLTAEAGRRDPEGLRRADSQLSLLKIYSHALVGLAMDQIVPLEDALPETLALDLTRLQDMRAKAVRIVVIGAILLTAKNLLKRESRSQWKVEAGRLWQLLSSEEDDGAGEPTTAQKAFSILETAHNMPPATKQQLSGTVARFLSQAATATASSSPGFTDPVLKVLYSRLRGHMTARLSAATTAERVRVASGASESLASCGLPEFVTHVSAMVEMMERIREVDWNAHGRWLNGIATEVGAED